MGLNAAVLVQAHMDSQRLPGKVLEPIGDATMLAHVMRRAQASGLACFVVAPAHDLQPGSPLRRECESQSFAYSPQPYDGPDADVLSRFADFVSMDARVSGVEVFVRVTADCPFLDPGQIRMAAAVCLAARDPLAIACNTMPDRPVDGWDVEAFTRQLLFTAAKFAEGPQREHVTPWMYLSGLRYTFARDTIVGHKRPGFNQYRWTVDTPEDLAWARAVHAKAGNPWPPNPTTDQMLMLMDLYPELRRYTE